MRRDEPPRPLKRARTEVSSELDHTRVLLLRGITAESSRKDLVGLCAEVGVVEQVQLLREKSHALVQFDSQEAADFCLLHYTHNPAYLRGSPVTFAYSGKREMQLRAGKQACAELLLTITQAKYPVTQEVVAALLSSFGALSKVRIFPRSFGFQVLIRLETTQIASQAREKLDGQNIYSGCNMIKAEYSPIPALAEEPEPSQSEDSGCVLFLQNLSEALNPDMLFSLFSLYGIVQKVKIFFTRKDLGLVQMEESVQASQSVTYLQDLPLLGRKLQVSLSRTSFINMSCGEPKATFCRDYSDSRLHRYKQAGRVCAPSAVLHLSNLPPTIGEGFLRRLFTQQAEVLSLRFLGPDMRQALVRFASVEEAVRVLVYHHNETLDSHCMRISFSRAAN